MKDLNEKNNVDVSEFRKQLSEAFKISSEKTGMATDALITALLLLIPNTKEEFMPWDIHVGTMIVVVNEWHGKTTVETVGEILHITESNKDERRGKYIYRIESDFAASFVFEDIKFIIE